MSWCSTLEHYRNVRRDKDNLQKRLQEHRPQVLKAANDVMVAVSLKLPAAEITRLLEVQRQVILRAYGLTGESEC